eukprot:TRINITY_DN32322_c0_g1_i1.p1 TRINITY_DN32322_c0_g1~~TRINITY_DN32322_c0_g1_i1.p1  ORF type:complete len:1183 (+),score=274.32 TRINITY_DN32322_c0_g1_i1:143-3691(+)
MATIRLCVPSYVACSVAPISSSSSSAGRSNDGGDGSSCKLRSQVSSRVASWRTGNSGINLLSSNALKAPSLRSTRQSPNLSVTSSLGSAGPPDTQEASAATIQPDNGRAATLSSGEALESGKEVETLVESSDMFSLRIENNRLPGATVVELQGVHQEDLLIDVTSVFAKFNLSVQEARILTQGQRVLDVFVVVDAERLEPLSTEMCASVQEAILKKLEQRKRIQTSQDDPKLAEQASFLCTLLEKVVDSYGQGEILEAGHFLQQGFRTLREKEDPRKRAELLRYVEKMDLATLTGVIRLYYLYSSLLNVADEAHAHRKRREAVWASRSATPLWYASFDHTLRLFKKMDVGPKEVQALLNKIEYNPVFTAHPTEARRREILLCLHRIFRLCTTLEDPRWSVAQRTEIEESVEAEVEILWRTDEMRGRKPSVLEEVKTGLDYFRLSLFDAVCTTYRYAENSLSHIYPKDGITVPSFIKFGSWIGGDRDGNPFVLPETTEVAALLQSRLILAEYVKRCRACEDTLTHSLLICGVSKEMSESLEKEKGILAKVPSMRNDAEVFEMEPYRLKLRIMRYRLEQNMRKVNTALRTFSKAGFGDEWLVDLEFNLEDIPGVSPEEDTYENEEGFRNDLKLIDSSMRANGDSKLANRWLKDLIRLADTFGFHLCALDVRQESNIHTEAVVESLQLLGYSGDYSQLSNDERMKLLAEYLRSAPPNLQDLKGRMTDSTKEVIKVFEAIANIKDNISPLAVASYVISMTRTSSHIIEVLFLGWFVNRNLVLLNEDGSWKARLVVAPLFETIPDLENMPGALEALLADPTYKEILGAWDNVQEIMLGYSDSCKDGGITASQFNLYKAQEVIRGLTQTAGVKTRIFHGRGGTVGRGAGPTHESVLAQPPGSVDGKIKFTEQGEVITYRYGNSETATYELSVGITAVMKASHPATRPPADMPSEYLERIEVIVAGAESAYRDLTDNTEGFYDYFYDATVVNEIALMNIGSRPARRKAAVRDKSSLRAIPWVFGWSQSRHTLPGWYGVGSGLLAYTGDRPEKIRELQQMYQDWPFFRTFLSNVQMSLGKASMEIAKEYARLCESRITERLVFDLVAREYELTISQILMVTQQNALQEDNEALKRSFETRRDYLDPLNHMQIILLGRRRDPKQSEEEKAMWEKPLLRSIKAIASNVRNTG